MPLKDEINNVKANAEPLLQAEVDKQTPLIQELQPFKGLPGEDFGTFANRLYGEFDTTVTHRDSAMI